MTQTRTVTGHFHTVPLPLSCRRKVSQPGPDPAKLPRRSAVSGHSTRATAVLLPRPLLTPGRPSLCPGTGVANRPLSKFLFSSCHRYFSLRRARSRSPLFPLLYICISRRLAELADVSWFSLPRYQHVRHHDVNKSIGFSKRIYNPAVDRENVSKSVKFCLSPCGQLTFGSCY